MKEKRQAWYAAFICIRRFSGSGRNMVGKSVIPSMVLGTFASLVTLFLELGHGMGAILFPWTTPYLPVREFGEGFAENGPNPYTVMAITILSVLFIVSLAFCLVYYSKSEVHSGS